jgi:rubrerythrin
MTISQEIREKLLVFQKNEITEHHIYMRLAGAIKASENRHILERIAQDELRPYREWRAHTQQDVKPDQLKMTLRSEKGCQGL